MAPLPQCVLKTLPVAPERGTVPVRRRPRARGSGISRHARVSVVGETICGRSAGVPSLVMHRHGDASRGMRGHAAVRAADWATIRGT